MILLLIYVFIPNLYELYIYMYIYIINIYIFRESPYMYNIFKINKLNYIIYVWLNDEIIKHFRHYIFTHLKKHKKLNYIIETRERQIVITFYIFSKWTSETSNDFKLWFNRRSLTLTLKIRQHTHTQERIDTRTYTHTHTTSIFK